MPNTSARTASDVAERIRKDIQTLSINGIHVTVSIGVSETKSTGNIAEKLIKKADETLYKAKGDGKNKVLCANNK
jgi:diguanylate cyclase (GGDEF)-like protein